ncbi:MAG: ATP-binding protein, partial [Chloroflexota bacterium]
MNKLPLANYQKEQEIFNSIVNSSIEPNILMFKGESGSGKSHLIDHCLKQFGSSFVAHMRLEHNTESIGTLLNILGSGLNLSRVPLFNETICDLVGEAPEESEARWPIKLRRYLREIGRFTDLETKSSHFQLLTDSLFSDISNLDETVLIAVDTYEKCSTEFDRWFTEEFLFGVAHAPHIKLIVSGQSLPQPSSDWDSRTIYHQLNGVADVHAWELWGDLLGLKLPSADVITGICLALKGNPSAIVGTLRSQFSGENRTDQRSQAVNQSPAMSAYNQRKLLRENII